MFLKPLDNAAFKTPIGIKIQQAVNKDLAVTNWGLNLEICDDINAAKDGPQMAINAVRAALQPRSDRQTDNTLILLDTLIKNCGRRFHLLVATRDFMCDLIRLVSPRDPTSQEVKDKALSMVERCSDAFKNDKDLAAVGEAYQYLKTQKVQFPAQNLDDMVAIHTPRASHSVIDPPVPHRAQNPAPVPPPAGGAVPPPGTVYNVQGAAAGGGGLLQSGTPVTLVPGTVYTQPPPPQYHPSGISHADLTRVNKELLVVRGNDAVMNDILADLQGNSNPNPGDLQLLRDLHKTCKEMYKRMIELLEQVVEETLVCQLLDLIDKLNNTFLRYERYERNLVLSSQPDQHGAPAPLAAPAPPVSQPASQGEATNIYATPVPTSTQRASPAPATAIPRPVAAPSTQRPGAAAPSTQRPGAAATSTQRPGAAATSQRSATARSSDIEELLSLDVGPTVTPPALAAANASTGGSVNPFQEFLDAPVTRLPPVSPGSEDQENIYTTAPAKVPNTPEEVGTLASQTNNLVVQDEFDMFAQSRSSTLNERVQAGTYNTLENNEDWLKDFDNIEPSTTAMTNDELDKFLNERAPAPPTTTLNTEPSQQGGSRQPKKRDDNDLFAL